MPTSGVTAKRALRLYRSRILLMLAVCSGIGWIPLKANALLNPSGPEFVINTFTDSTQFSPDVVSTGRDQFLVVWSGKPSVFETYTSIHGQRVAEDGSKVGSEFLVNTTGLGDTSNEQYPRVAASRQTGFIVVWENNRDDDGSEYGVFGQRLDDSVNKIGAQFLVNAYTTGEQLSPLVAAAPDGTFVAVWRDAGLFGELRHDLTARWFNSDGTPRSDDIRIASSEDGEPILPDVEIDSVGYAVIAWQALGKDGDGDAVVAQRYDAGNNPSGALAILNARRVGDQGSVDVAVAVTDEIIAVWQGPDADQTGIYGQRFTSELERIGPQFQMNTYTTGWQQTPRIAVSGDGSFVVIWDSKGQDGDGAGVFAQLFDPTGTRDGPELQVNIYTAGDQGNSRADLSVEVGEKGVVFVAWESDGQDGSSTAIVGRSFCIVGHAGRDCGDPLCDDGAEVITASDALLVLNVGVGLQRCAACVCDVNHTSTVTATDALVLLTRVADPHVPLSCPSCG